MNLMIYMLWIVVMRFKRIEVQVVKDANENNYHIFSKLRVINSYNTVFMLLLFVFQVPLFLFIFDTLSFMVTRS